MKKGDKVKYIRNESYPSWGLSLRKGKIIVIWHNRVLVEGKDGDRDWILKRDILK